MLSVELSLYELALIFPFPPDHRGLNAEVFEDEASEPKAREAIDYKEYLVE